jgi:hypothetical protein
VRFRRFAPLIGIGALALAAVFMATARGAAAAWTAVAYSFDAASPVASANAPLRVVLVGFKKGDVDEQ